MDFHSLTRRELQALCKKDKIPANITNVAMLDALKALHTVQGIEELLLKPSESSIQTPARSQGTTVRHPKTTVKEDESETLQTLTRTRCSTRRLVAAAGGDVDEASDNRRKGTLAASACRKMETQFNEIEEEEEDNVGKEKEKFSETPAIMAANRQRGLKGETTLKHTYSTRRSARLAAKNMEDSSTIMVKEGSQTVKAELFPREILNINVKKDCPADVDPVTESSVTGADLLLKSEQELDNSYNAEVVSGTKSYCSMENHNNFQIDCNEDSGEDSEIGESKMTVESDGGVAQGDRCDNESNKANTNKTEDALENGEELDTNEEMGSNDVAAEDVAEVIDHNDLISSESADVKMSEGELLESNKDFGLSNYTNASFEDGKKLNDEKEMESEDGAAQSLVDDDKDKSSDNLDALMNINDGVVESNESGENDSDLLVPKTEQAVDNLVEISASGEEAFVDHLAGKFIAMELNTSAANRDTLKQLGHDNLNDVVVPTSSSCLTPNKKESPTPRKSTATPLKKSVSKKKTPTAAAKRTTMTQEVSDDKENIGDNGTNLIIAKEKEEKQTRGENFQKPLDEQSLRQLTKMLKEKLEITKKLNTNDDKLNTKAASTARPALQALSENRLGS